jgi:hypothetical protein
MLINPNIIKMPSSSYPISGIKGCGTGFTGCASSFSCSPYGGGSCIDMSYDTGCQSSFAAVVGGGATIIAGIVGGGVVIT